MHQSEFSPDDEHDNRQSENGVERKETETTKVPQISSEYIC